jgi:predicted cation transporter
MNWNWIIILQGLLGVAMLSGGTMNLLSGQTTAKKNFSQLRLPQAWLVPIGVLQILVALGLMIGFFDLKIATLSAAIATIMMLAGTAIHVFMDKNGFQGYSALSLLLINAVVLFQHVL